MKNEAVGRVKLRQAGYVRTAKIQEGRILLETWEKEGHEKLYTLVPVGEGHIYLLRNVSFGCLREEGLRSTDKWEWANLPQQPKEAHVEETQT